MMESGKVVIIAEAGVNHNGSLETAERLIEQAAASGADVVKFQLFEASALVRRTTPKVTYQRESDSNSETQQQMLARLQLSRSEMSWLIKQANAFGIEFLCTAFDLPDLDFLCELGMSRIKIPSGEITNRPLLISAARKQVPVLLSTGTSNLDEVIAAVEVLFSAGLAPEDLSILQCTSAYPTPPADVNLRVIPFFAQRFGVRVGFSDHTLGDHFAIAAVALGATIVEKHFTLDPQQPGPDHRVSLDPSQFTSFVLKIRSLEQGLGDGIKTCMSSEKEVRFAARKSIVASVDIHRGQVFGIGNLSTKRPASGQSPMDFQSIIGKTALRSYQADEDIDAAEFES